MASIDAIARIREQAVAKLASNAEELAKALGIEGLPELPTNRDQLYKHAIQLQTLADYIEGVTKAVKKIAKKVKEQEQKAKEHEQKTNAQQTPQGTLPPGADQILNAAHNSKKA